MCILKSISPGLEIYSIDEAFMDVRGIQDLLAFGTMVRKTIKQWTGITVAVGMAPTKTLAKLANYGAKTVDSHLKILWPASHVARCDAPGDLRIYGKGLREAAVLNPRYCPKLGKNQDKSDQSS